MLYSASKHLKEALTMPAHLFSPTRPIWRRPTWVTLVALLGLGGAPAHGQPVAGPRVLASPEQVGASLYASAREVLVVTPYLRSQAVADGLRRAAVERGARVFVLADDRYVAEPASYLTGLSLVRGVQVRLLRGLSVSQATVDRKVTLAGPLIADVADPLSAQATLAERSPRKVAQASAWFTRNWSVATPYTYRPAPR